MPQTGKPNERMQDWIDARKRHGLSHAEVQMARELGMNPKKLGKLDNHQQEPWKMPLRQFIQHLYFKRFGKERPEIVQTIEGTSCATRRRRNSGAKPDRLAGKAI